MRSFPNNQELTKDYTIQSEIFGHRFKPNQTVDEYLLEFLQVLIAEKEINTKENITSDYFPDIDEEKLEKIIIHPKAKVALKRFVFYMKSKDEARSEIDSNAYKYMVDFLKERINVDYEDKQEEIVQYIEKLLYGFSGVIKNRAWFAQSFLPVCKSMVLPETMIGKAKRKKLDKDFKFKNEIDKRYGKVDSEIDANQYDFMRRGGEIYYLHVLRGLIKNPEKKEKLVELFEKQLNEYSQIENLCDKIQDIWEEEIKKMYPDSSFKKDINKTLGTIPVEFGDRENYTISELINFLSSNMHPFEKIELLSQGIVFQLINLMHSEARYRSGKNTRPVWVVDMTYSLSKDAEVKKLATKSYDQIEEDMIIAISRGIEESNVKKVVNDKDKSFKDAIEDSYKLCRKSAKDIGILVPIKGSGMRITLQENIIKFLVVSIVEPGKKLTLTTFIEKLYEHFGIVIGRNEYKREMIKENVEKISDFSFLDKNEKALSEMLKKCSFLRDLSDATAIVENPY